MCVVRLCGSQVMMVVVGKNPKAHVLNFFYVVSNVRNWILICLCNGVFILF